MAGDEYLQFVTIAKKGATPPNTHEYVVVDAPQVYERNEVMVIYQVELWFGSNGPKTVAIIKLNGREDPAMDTSGKLQHYDEDPTAIVIDEVQIFQDPTGFYCLREYYFPNGLLYPYKKIFLHIQNQSSSTVNVGWVVARIWFRRVRVSAEELAELLAST